MLECMYDAIVIGARCAGSPTAMLLARRGLRVIRFDVGPFALVGSAPPAFSDSRGDYAPRRTILDAILVEAAVASGAELRENVSVERLLVEDGRVTGVRAQSSDGSIMVEHGSIVIGLTACVRSSRAAWRRRSTRLHPR
jgi:flavin-dependent dehydrogenase